MEPWTLKAAMIGGRDVLDEPIDLRPGEEIDDVRLTVTDRITELSGKVSGRLDTARPARVGCGFPGRQETLVAGLAPHSAVRPDADWRVHHSGAASRARTS